jgi:hypothetical protein
MRYRRPAKADCITVRLETELREKFCEKAYSYSTPSDLLREFINAFVEDRLHMDPPTRERSLYVPRSQD